MQNLKEKPASIAVETGAKKFYTRANGYNVRPTNNIIAHKNKKFNNFNNNLFGDIKNLLDIRYALEVYGVQFNSKGYASCPFHHEKTASFKVYADSFHCFGCGACGDIINFTARYFNLSNIDAAKKLNADFNLNLLDSPSASRASIEKIQQDKQLLKDFEKWEKKAHRAVSDYYHALRFWGKQLYVKQVKYFEKYQPDLENIVFVEAMLDLMIANTSDLQAQIKFYREFGEAVTAIERRICDINA